MNTSPDAQLNLLLHEAELEAERVVARLRVFVAIGLGLFLTLIVDPTEAATRDAILARQWLYATGTILAYLVMGLVTWGALRLGVFRRWMIWPTATIDVVFVIVSVRLSMENTGFSGDAAFVLPSIWLAPLIVSFGALRANPRVTIYIVILTLVGVGRLISIPTGQGSDGTEGGVWLFLSLPPNVMRMTMLALSGLVVIIAVRRARALLTRSIGIAQRNANLTRYLPAQLAQRLGVGGLEELQRGRRAQMAVLFVDMRGFTRWAQNREPQEVTDLITAYRARIARVVDETGGMIDKFMGDAAMVLFDGADDPQQAARACITCAERLNQTMQRWTDQRMAAGDTPVAVGIGLHWGEVFSGVVGDQARLEYSVFGDVVNTAARLEQMTRDPQGGVRVAIIASRDIMRAAGHTDVPSGWSALPDVELRGRDGRLPVLGRGADAAGPVRELV